MVEHSLQVLDTGNRGYYIDEKPLQQQTYGRNIDSSVTKLRKYNSALNGFAICQIFSIAIKVSRYFSVS